MAFKIILPQFINSKSIYVWQRTKIKEDRKDHACVLIWKIKLITNVMQSAPFITSAIVGTHWWICICWNPSMHLLLLALFAASTTVSPLRASATVGSFHRIWCGWVLCCNQKKLINHLIRCIAIRYWIFKSLQQFKCLYKKSLETYWIHHVRSFSIKLNHERLVEQN